MYPHKTNDPTGVYISTLVLYNIFQPRLTDLNTLLKCQRFD